MTQRELPSREKASFKSNIYTHTYVKYIFIALCSAKRSRPLSITKTTIKVSWVQNRNDSGLSRTPSPIWRDFETRPNFEVKTPFHRTHIIWTFFLFLKIETFYLDLKDQWRPDTSHCPVGWLLTLPNFLLHSQVYTQTSAHTSNIFRFQKNLILKKEKKRDNW